MLKLKVLACDVLRREIFWLASKSPCYVDVTFLSQGLHVTPDKLRAALGENIEKANREFPYRHFEEIAGSGVTGGEHYDYIIIAYGLCDNGIVNLSSPEIPVVIPRAHDCISLILGSRKRYNELFNQSPGTYWYSRGWIECSIQPGEERYLKTRQSYIDKFGEENADYLMEMEQGWFKKYDRAFFINWEELGNTEYYRSYTKECAAYLKWKYEECNGSPLLLEKLLGGCFDEEEVLIVPPGKSIAASFDEDIIKAV